MDLPNQKNLLIVVLLHLGQSPMVPSLIIRDSGAGGGSLLIDPCLPGIFVSLLIKISFVHKLSYQVLAENQGSR